MHRNIKPKLGEAVKVKKIHFLSIGCLVLLMANAFAGNGVYDASLAEWVNLLPAVPQVGQSASFTAKMNPKFRGEKVWAVFRSHTETLSLPLFDDGSHKDGAPNDGVFGCTFPTQKNAALWYCIIACGENQKNLRYGTPKAFIVTENATEYRTLWVDSWNDGFLTRAQAEKLVETARSANINALIVEVRKTGDAYYDSAYEPHASNIEDPAFDPLKCIIDLAHDTSGGKRRIEVHAWIVAFRIYKGSLKHGMPKSPHILGKHPEWASVNAKGENIGEKGTIYLDPGAPAVSDYTIDVCLDIVKKYDVDGINFDYIRYPGGGWGYNPIALERFHKLYPAAADTERPSPGDTLWCEFKRNQVTNFLRKVYVKLIAEKPSLKVSVCTIGWGDIPDGNFKETGTYRAGIQDWENWHHLHILDVNFRMGYKRQHIPKYKKQFNNWTHFTLRHQSLRISPVGIGSYLNTISGTLEQIKIARKLGASGLVFFSYASTNGEKLPADKFFKTLKKRAFQEWLDVPPLAWKIANPNGIIAGSVYGKGKPLDGAEVSLPEIHLATKTDGTGFYAFIDVPPGKHKIALRGRTVGETEVRAGVISTFNIPQK